MLIASIIIFLIAIVFGLIVLVALLEGRKSPKKAVLIHGVLAGSALLLVIIYLIINGASSPLIAGLILLILGALGGLTLFTLDRKKKPIPKLLIILHPIVAVVGLVILIAYVLP